MSGIVTYYLEMKSSAELVARDEVEGLLVRECEETQYQYNRYLYQLVGTNWQWTGKLSWSDEQWKKHAESDGLRMWVAYCRGTPAGYYELRREGREVEILYFGLAPGFIGRGFGAYLLTHAIRSAWGWAEPRRVWVHTCSLDHPHALKNYQSRGMKLYQTESEEIRS